MTRQLRWGTWSGVAALAVAASPVARSDRRARPEEGRRGADRQSRRAADPRRPLDDGDLTEVLTNHLYEGLYALDEGYRPIPMLAEALPMVSPDGLTYAIRLRRGSSSTTARR